MVIPLLSPLMSRPLSFLYVIICIVLWWQLKIRGHENSPSRRMQGWPPQSPWLRCTVSECLSIHGKIETCLWDKLQATFFVFFFNQLTQSIVAVNLIYKSEDFDSCSRILLIWSAASRFLCARWIWFGSEDESMNNSHLWCFFCLKFCLNSLANQTQ